MPKIDFKILAKKKGPLPVWAWALISAVLVYMLYRHFRSTEDSGGSSSPDLSQSQMSGGSGGVDTGLGDMAGGGVGNAGNADLGDLGLQHNIDAVKGQITDLTDFLGASQTQAANDAAQGTDTTAEAQDTTEQGAPLGLVHITGKYWWDPDSHKLVTIPGSGGAKKGSGKVAKPNKNKAGGKKKVGTKPKKQNKVGPAKSGWTLVSNKPPKVTKKKTVPKPKQPKLTKAQRAAIDRAHHPRPRPPIKKKTKNVRTIRPPRPQQPRKVLHPPKGRTGYLGKH